MKYVLIGFILLSLPMVTDYLVDVQFVDDGEAL
jgi:hypothetical protein